EAQWADEAAHARAFVEAMWDEGRGCYLTGTIDPETRNTSPIPMDVQAWAVLSVPGVLAAHPGLLAQAEQNHLSRHDGFLGFDFDDDKDGTWFEGTGHFAVVYAHAGQPASAELFRQELRRAQAAPFSDGLGTPAASHDGLSTGFGFKYFR